MNHRVRFLAPLAALAALLALCVNLGTTPTSAQPLNPQGGGVKTVTAGSGLTGGGTGAVTVNVGAGSGILVGADTVTIDSTYTQRRISTGCTVGNAIQSVNQDGSVTCASGAPADTVTGTVTSPDLIVATGAHTVGNYAGSTASACSAGQAVTQVVLSAAGIVTSTCATTGITNAAGNNVIPKSNGTNLVASSLSDNATTISSSEPIDMASHKITSLTNGASAQDAAAFGQIATGVNAAVSGTTNTVPKFTGTNVIGNSSVTDNGSTVSTSENISGAGITATSYVQAFSGDAYLYSQAGVPSLDFLTGTNGTGKGYINKIGFSAGTTQFRDLEIDDGKGAAIVTITGSTKAAVFAGAVTAAGALTAQANLISNAGSITTLGQTRFGTISVSLTGGATVNDWAPSGLADAYTIFTNCPSSQCTITGIVGGADGRHIQIYNTGAGEIDMPNNGAGSTAANRFNNNEAGGTLVLIANSGCSADFTYSSADSFWHETGRACNPWVDSGVTLATGRAIATTSTVVATSYGDFSGGVFAGGGLADSVYLALSNLGYEYNTNGAATGHINAVGYAQGTTQPRSEEINDGQGTGSTHRFWFSDAVNNAIAIGRSASDSITFNNGPKGINGEQGKHLEWAEEFLWSDNISATTNQGPLSLSYAASGTGAGIGMDSAVEIASGRDDRVGIIAMKTGTATNGGYVALTSGKTVSTSNSKTLTFETTLKWDTLSSSSNSVASEYASLWGFTDTSAATPVGNVVNGCYFAYDKGNVLTAGPNSGNIDAVECWCANASTRTKYLINNSGNSDETFALGVGAIVAQTWYRYKIVWSSTRAEFYRATGATYTKVCDINTNMPSAVVGPTFTHLPLASTGTGDRHMSIDQATFSVDLNAVKSP